MDRGFACPSAFPDWNPMQHRQDVTTSPAAFAAESLNPYAQWEHVLTSLAVEFSTKDYEAVKGAFTSRGFNPAYDYDLVSMTTAEEKLAVTKLSVCDMVGKILGLLSCCVWDMVGKILWNSFCGQIWSSVFVILW